MLDNEPKPAAEAAATEPVATPTAETPAATPAPETPETTTPRRTRRRPVKATAQADGDAVTARSAASGADMPSHTGGSAPETGGPAPAGAADEPAAAPRTRRARKTAKAAAATPDPLPGAAEPAAGDASVAVPATAAPTEAAPDQPVKATRTRRKKAVPAATAADAADHDVPGDTGTARPAPAAAASTDVLGATSADTGSTGADPAKPAKRTRRTTKRDQAPVGDSGAATPGQPVESGPSGTAEVPGATTGTSGTGPSPSGAAGPSAAGPSSSSGTDQPGDTGRKQPDAVAGGAESGASPTEGAPPARTRRRAVAATVLFMPPSEVPTAAVTPPLPPSSVTERPAAERPTTERPAAERTRAERPAAEEPDTEDGAVETGRTRRRRSRRGAEPVETAPVEAEDSGAEPVEDEDEDELSASGRRRRRRGRRGRGRGRGGADDEFDDESGDDEEPEAGPTAEAPEAEPEAESDDEAEDETGEEGVTRRRRRRRRKGAGETEAVEDDGVPTVVRIREPRAARDEVQGVSGSTRLEAKRQRRRDGREQRRTRPPILTESEFLARREAVDRVMVVRQKGDRTQIAVLEDGILVEHYVTRSSTTTMAGNVYLGRVQNVLPSMEAAFVDIGRGRNAVLYAGEVNWDKSGLEGRARSIEHAMRSGDSVLVQVTKDPIGHKGARLTSHIALSGRHLVYVPNGNASGISRKLPDVERKRLRDVLKKLVPEGAGVIVRTAAEGATEDELARDIKRLQTQWEDIRARTSQGGAPKLLSEEPDLVIRVVRDLFNEDFRELVVQGEEAYGLVEPYLAHVSPDLLDRLRRHTGVKDVFAELRIDEQLLKALDRKVFLPSGGSLVIDRTEAMTVIDVNTGKYTGTGGNLEETVTRNNLEAAEEIVRQLRLRDLGGIVVIDFIDMVLESNRELVLRRLTECLGRDRTKHQVTEITSLGLVQMTRKRVGQGLLEAFSETCECCKGRGVIVHTDPTGDRPAKQNQGNAAVAKVAAARKGAATEEAPAAEAPATEGGNRPAEGGAAGEGTSGAESAPRTRRRGRKAAAAAGADGATQPVATSAPAAADQQPSGGADGAAVPDGAGHGTDRVNGAVNGSGVAAHANGGPGTPAEGAPVPTAGAGADAGAGSGEMGRDSQDRTDQGEASGVSGPGGFGDSHEAVLVGEGRRRSRRGGSRWRGKP